MPGEIYDGGNGGIYADHNNVRAEHPGVAHGERPDPASEQFTKSLDRLRAAVAEQEGVHMSETKAIPGLMATFDFQPKEVPQWEYLLLDHNVLSPVDLLDRLNELGHEGWQVCQRAGEFLILLREILPEADSETQNGASEN